MSWYTRIGICPADSCKENHWLYWSSPYGGGGYSTPLEMSVSHVAFTCPNTGVGLAWPTSRLSWSSIPSIPKGVIIALPIEQFLKIRGGELPIRGAHTSYPEFLDSESSDLPF